MHVNVSVGERKEEKEAKGTIKSIPLTTINKSNRILHQPMLGAGHIRAKLAPSADFIMPLCTLHYYCLLHERSEQSENMIRFDRRSCAAAWVYIVSPLRSAT